MDVSSHCHLKILSRTESCVLKYNETSYDSLYITILFFHSLEPTEMNYLITIVYNNEYIIILYHIFLQKLLCNSFEHVICIRHWL